MRLRPFATALTLVGLMSTAVFAAPKTDELDLDSTEKNNTGAPTDPSQDIQTLDVAKPPPASVQLKEEAPREIFFPYQSSVSPRMGTGIKNQYRGDSPNFYFLGLNYMFDSSNARHFEVGFDLTSDTFGLLHIARKWVYNSTSSIRPHFKVGPSIKLVADQQLGTFLRYENYQLRVAGGFEKLIKPPMSIRLDLETAWVSGGYEVALAFGYSWAW